MASRIDDDVDLGNGDQRFGVIRQIGGAGLERFVR